MDGTQDSFGHIFLQIRANMFFFSKIELPLIGKRLHTHVYPLENWNGTFFWNQITRYLHEIKDCVRVVEIRPAAVCYLECR
jgi:hypothetical protein